MNKNYKRQYRELSDDTKKKIQAATTGKQKSAIHKQHISQGMIKYWRQIPNKPHQSITMDELIGKRENNTSMNKQKDETNM